MYPKQSGLSTHFDHEGMSSVFQVCATQTYFCVFLPPNTDFWSFPSFISWFLDKAAADRRLPGQSCFNRDIDFILNPSCCLNQQHHFEPQPTNVKHKFRVSLATDPFLIPRFYFFVQASQCSSGSTPNTFKNSCWCPKLTDGAVPQATFAFVCLRLHHIGPD